MTAVRYTSEERLVFAECIIKYPVLVDTGYSAAIVKQKADAWAKITEEFNASNAGKPPYEAQQLKGLFRRLKDEAKSAQDNYKKLSQKTGGGPSKPAFKNKAVELVAGLIGNAYDPLKDPFDDDVLPFQEGPSEQRREELLEVIEIEEIPIMETPQRNKAKKRKRDTFEDSMLKMAEEESQAKLKEHAKRMAIMEIQEEDYQAKMREHAKRMAILEIEEETARCSLLLMKAEMRKAGCLDN